MRTFNVNARYDLSRDVRDHSNLLALTRVPAPNGVLYPLVAARRAGKTWTLLALERLCVDNGFSSQFIDMRRGELPAPENVDSQCLLLDEPQLAADAHIPRDSGAFLEWCDKLHNKHVAIVLAMSPAEWITLKQAGHKNAFVSQRDLQYLAPLNDAQADKLARTPTAKALLADLPSIWTKNPYLLELVFQVAEDNEISHPCNMWDLLRRVRDRSRQAECEYYKFLTEPQRETLRCLARAESSNPEELELLARCGIIRKENSRYVLADPILEANLSPLRIHHVSDLHFGPKSAERLVVKTKGEHADRLKGGLGPNSVAHDYLGHLEKLKQDGLAPHLLVISGDVAETAKESEFAEAKQWIEKAAKQLGDHPRLPPDAPNVLLAGGNHDVDWEETDGASGPRKRHLPFARAFDGMARLKRVNLEEPPEKRELTVARYPDLGIDILLLGSAEFGGEDEKDPVRLELFKLMMNVRKVALDTNDEERLRALEKQTNKIDPGLVHHEDLQKIRGYSWHLPVRIAVLHHPVSPLPTTELKHYVGLINAGEVKDRLVGSGFCLVLHGHAHTGRFFHEQWPGEHKERSLRIASAPSLGSREVQERHGYNEVTIARDTRGGEVTYTVEVRRHGWVGTQWPEQGNPMRFRIPDE